MMTLYQSKDPRVRIVKNLQAPVRIVMNNKTFAVYEGDKFETRKLGFNMKHTALLESKFHKNCFILREGTQEAEFCNFGMNSSPRFYNEWDYEFNLFKYQCSSERAIIKVNFTADLEKQLKEKTVILLLKKYLQKYYRTE